MKWKIFAVLYFSLYAFIKIGECEKLSQSACKIIAEVLKKEFWMKTIAIVEFRNNFKIDVTENLLKCLPSDVSKVFIHVRENEEFEKMRVHSPSVNILIADEVTEMEVLYTLVLDYYKKPILNHNSKFLLLTSHSTDLSRAKIKSFLNICSIEDFTIVFNSSEEIYMETKSILQKFNASKIFEKQPQSNVKVQHNIFVHEQLLRVKYLRGQIRMKFMHFLKAVEEFENSQMTFLIAKTKDQTILREIIDQLTINREFEMTPNTLMSYIHAAPGLMIYENTAECVLMPLPRRSSSSMIFFKPFDLLIWLLILITIISMMILWRFGSNSTSAWFIPFFFWAFYHGQSINFNTKRKVFVILLQITVFMLFILGNAYQGLITSFMIAEDEPQKLESFDELLESDIKIIVGGFFDFKMQENLKYVQIRNSGRVKILRGNDSTIFNLAALYSSQTAVVMECDLVNSYLTSGLASNFYSLKENLFPQFVRLQTIFLSKFLRRWQLLMDWSFEAGLPKAWENVERDQKIFNENVEENPEKVLRIDEIFVAFCVLIFGLLLSALALICEIFWHGFGVPYLRRRKYQKHNEENLSLRERQEKKFKFLKKHSRLRKIQVQPVEETSF